MNSPLIFFPILILNVMRSAITYSYETGYNWSCTISTLCSKNFEKLFQEMRKSGPFFVCEHLPELNVIQIGLCCAKDVLCSDFKKV